ncbi:MAG TPA: condensation domain-containing protein [Candidatus Angelobacter sp.]
MLMKHPGVAHAAVVIWENDDEKCLLAYVVSGQQGTFNQAEIQRHLRSHLPSYMVPDAFVQMDRLPLTTNGKIDQKALPTPQEHFSRQKAAVPRSSEEEILCGLYAELLKRTNVGADEDFFALGGHSLLATRLISRLHNIFGVELSLRVLFETATVAGLAARVREARGAPTHRLPPLERAERRSDLPLSYAQQRLWFLHQLQPESAAYNIHFGVRFTGWLDKKTLRQSFNAMVRRHEILRTTFPVRDGRPVQNIASESQLDCEELDLQRIVKSEIDLVVRKAAYEEANRPFDLQHGPLLRLKLLKLDDRQHVLLLTLHHIISDGWSTSILIREFARLYEAYGKGEDPGLPELPVQYADFAIWQRQWLQEEVLERQLAFWRKHLAGAPPLELPIDFPDNTMAGGSGARENFHFGNELTQQLRFLSRHEGATLFMTLLAGFQLMLARYTGQDEIVIGTDIANRTRLETEGLIGFFVNQLVLRGDLSGNPSFREILRRVRTVVLQAHEHQDLPFERLVQELAPERNLEGTPLFRVKLVLQNMGLSDLALPEISVSEMDLQEMTAKFDILVNIVEAEDGLHAFVHYRSSLFKPSTVQSLLHFYHATLVVIAQNGQILDVTKQELLGAIARKARELRDQFFTPLGLLASRQRQGRLIVKA